MDKETWMALSNEIEPVLRKVKEIATNYKLKDCLSIAAFAGDVAWVVYNEYASDTPDGRDHLYKAEVDEHEVFSVSDQTTTYIRS